MTWMVEEAVGHATSIGSRADCPFCLSRSAGMPDVGELVMLLSGPDTGIWGKVVQAKDGRQSAGFHLQTDPSDLQSVKLVFPRRELALRLSDIRVPSWLPPFSIRHCYEIESLVHFFANRCLGSGRFHWKEDEVAMLAVGLWQGKLKITPKELSEAAIAHGMPSDRQDQFEKLYTFGQSCLTSAAKRFPVEKWRNSDAFAETVTQALRYSYRWS